jgi:hypothetical protein
MHASVTEPNLGVRVSTIACICMHVLYVRYTHVDQEAYAVLKKVPMIRHK